ncbi:MAG: threonine synthase [Deltaproteobacteria bacterium]|nr:threonine synthase [Deltaproteobacteria bacterium]MBW2309635.1 threonine synthase [Deltaproteobacteria bacterium]
MKLAEFPEDIRNYLIPEPSGKMLYRCLMCRDEFDIDHLLYTCPSCGGILMLSHQSAPALPARDGALWRRIFDFRRMLNVNPLKGIFRYYEFIAPIIPLEFIVYLGEAHTPMVMANDQLEGAVGRPFYFKNEGLNPSLSFKDRGMACALSFLNYLAKSKGIGDLLTICASTGDTSASAALYAAYLTDLLKSAVLLPEGKVTAQQLAQPLGSGATVLEMPGVFDDCMKVVETLSETYPVALLNSKNSWRILGQESYSFEIAQDFDYRVGDKVIVVPIGNAGNITAIISGFLKFLAANLIAELPTIVGVQSEHANPVYRYYLEDDTSQRQFAPVEVSPSVAQAAMIGNPVSMPRVIELVRDYNEAAGRKKIFFLEVSEQEIMDAMIVANKNGNISCTQGGESMAGFIKAIGQGLVPEGEIGVLAATAHVLKFSSFQEMYLTDRFPPEYKVKPRREFRNTPIHVKPKGMGKILETGTPTRGKDREAFIHEIVAEIARIVDLKKR